MGVKRRTPASSAHKRRLREAMHRFKTEHVLTQNPAVLGKVRITGIFLDRKDGEPRVIVLHSAATDHPKLSALVGRCFRGFQWKLVRQRSTAQGTAQSGADIFHDQHGGQGTVGGWLEDPNSRERYGFSNSHVIASLGQAPVGSPVFQSGHQVGGLRAHILLDQRVWNTADLALFTVSPGLPTTWAHRPPKGNYGATPGLRVYKQGSSSAYTEGTVVNGNGAVLVEFTGVGFWFNGIVSIQGDQGAFSEAGDSGALVMTRQGDYATAVLFAKDRYSGHSYACPIGAAYPLFRNLNYAQ